MERWIGKVAVVTGASSGIGAVISEQLTKSGLIVIGLARRVDRLEKLQKSLEDQNGEFHFYKCDVSNLDSIRKVFDWIDDKFGRLHILVNNAGLNSFTSILADGNEDLLKNVIDVNLMGYVFCVKAAYKIMLKTNEESHIINMSSIFGNQVMNSSASKTYNLYPASKFGVRAMAETLRQELISNENFRVTTISPGLVRTEIIKASNNPQFERMMATQHILDPQDISQTVLFILGLPKHAVVSEITIKPVGEKM